MTRLSVALARGTSFLWSSMRVLLAAAVLATLVVSLFIYRDGTHHFGYLADNLVHGSFSVNNMPAYYVDRVVTGDAVYLPFAPMPGILLMPFAGAFGLSFDELWLGHLFNAFNVVLALVMLRRLSLPARMHRHLLALFFCGTIYLSALSVARSWYLSHVIATTFLFLALDEALGQKRASLTGFWLGLAFLTRFPTIFSLPFFFWMLKPDTRSWFDRKWLLQTGIEMTLGLAAPFLFFLYYNYARYGDPFETGYAHSILANPLLEEARRQGLFSPVHIPKNLYVLLLAGPQPYPSISAPVLEFPYIYPQTLGMGLFFTTFPFVYIFFASRRERIVRGLWLAVVLVLIPLVPLCGVGWGQFGYRYALDLYPFLFALTALGMLYHFDRTARVLILLSIAVNVWGAWWQMLGFSFLPAELLR